MVEETTVSTWPEVRYINSYALFMGYLSMAIKGMAFLVVTWTTVILLGGFVSDLHKKDFWCLTVITLVQTAGVYDAFLNEKLKDIKSTLSVFLEFVEIRVAQVNSSLPMVLVEGVVAVLQALMFAIILCPLAGLYLSGLYMSAGISLARLVQRDYGGGDVGGGGTANLKPALDVLYSLAVAQGVLYTYWSFTRMSCKKQCLTEHVAREYKLDVQSVRDYLQKTKTGCEKDPSFGRERNFLTYAMDMMQSKSSPDDYFSGLKILGSILIMKDTWGGSKLVEYVQGWQRQRELIQELIGSPSSAHMLLKLLHTLDSRNPFVSTESRNHAAWIVGLLADQIRLNQFPGGIQCIASLLDASQLQDDNKENTPSASQRKEENTTSASEKKDDEAEGEGEGEGEGKEKEKEKEKENTPFDEFKFLMKQGLGILRKLATDEDNCRVIGSTPGLLSKIMAPVSSDLLHRTDHKKWLKIVQSSLGVMGQLAAAPGETGTKLRLEISGNVMRILECSKCNQALRAVLLDSKSDATYRISAAQILQHLCVHYTKDDDHLKNLKKTMTDVITKLLGEVLLDSKSATYRISAAQILQHLCVHYTEDDDHLRNLKKAMTDVMPKLLREILRCEPTEIESRAGAEAKKVKSASPTHDIENQTSAAPNSSSSSTPKQDEDRKLLAALLSLCVVVCDSLISADQDLTHQFGKITTGDASFSFPKKLEEMVERHSQPTANCLIIMKHTSKMVMSMMRHNCSYNEKDMDSLIKSLSTASEKMLSVEGFMIFDIGDDGAVKPTGTTLASLVEEARELLKKKKAEKLAMEARET